MKPNLLSFDFSSRASLRSGHQACLRWNRRSVARAVLVGLFVAPLPIPSQMLLAGLLATLLRANLPLAVSLVWLSNPLTIVPIAWFCTMLGCTLTGQDPAVLMGLSFANFFEVIEQLWRPLFAGALCCGLALGVAGYYATHWYWRSAVLRRWQERRSAACSRPVVAKRLVARA